MASGNVCDGCGKDFPCLDAAMTVCPKCKILEEHAINSENYKKIQDCPQCAMCGKCFRNMARVEDSVQICSSTECKVLASTRSILPTPAPLAQFATQLHGNSSHVGSSGATPIFNGITSHRATELSTTEFNRINSTRNRMKLSPAFQNAQPGTNLTTMSLKQQEQLLTAPVNDGMVFICWSYRRSDKARVIDPKLGAGSQTFSLGSQFVSEVQTHILRALNAEWNKLNASSLEFNEISLRFNGNIVLDEGTATISLRDFITYYSRPGKQLLAPSTIPPHYKHIIKSQKSPWIMFEGFIHVETYYKRRMLERPGQSDQEDYDMEMMAIGTSRRRHHRTRSESISLSNSRLPKRARTASATVRAGSTSMPMVSLFRLPQNTSRLIHKSTKIIFTKILCSVNSADGDTTFSEVQGSLSGFLHDRHLARGTMKAAFELILSDNEHHGQFVAKRFFRLAEDDSLSHPKSLGAGGIEIDVHNDLIRAECGRLFQGKWFLTAFYKLCSKMGVPVDTCIQFADAFLLREDANCSPSPASGAESYLAETSGVMWLTEGRRPSPVIRFTGTLSHLSSRSDLRSATLYAFVHFSFGHSNKSLVFADIQGTPTNIDGHDGLVLFDPMTHTLDGNSGIGDFGCEGINAFIRDHQCSEICKYLRLNQDVPLEIIEEDISGNELTTLEPNTHTDDHPEHGLSDEEDEDMDSQK